MMLSVEHVWDVLEKTCGAHRGIREEFLFHARDAVKSGRMLEFRFQGVLGFGGKVWFNNGSSVYVTCYPEDETRERRAVIKRANAELSGE